MNIFYSLNFFLRTCEQETLNNAIVFPHGFHLHCAGLSHVLMYLVLKLFLFLKS